MIDWGRLGLRCEKPVRKISVKMAKETEGSKTATVKLDEEQMRRITELFNEIKYSIDDIYIEPQVQSSDEAFFHVPSIVMRWVLKIFFCSISIALIYGGYSAWDSITASGNIIAIIVIVILLAISSLSLFIHLLNNR